jgi:hypothetical protein
MLPKKAHKTNGNKDKKHPDQLKKNEVDSNAAHIGNDNVSIASNVTSLGATVNVYCFGSYCQNAVNDDRTMLTEV